MHSLTPNLNLPIESNKKEALISSSSPFTNKNWMPSTGKLGANSKVIQKGGIIKQAQGTVCEIE